MDMGFWNFWIFIVFDIVIILAFIGWWIWFQFLDTRLRLILIYPDKRITLKRKKIKNNLVTVYDNNTETTKTYTINDKFIFYRYGRQPYAFFWDNIPIPIDITNVMELDSKKAKEYNKTINELNEFFPYQVNIKQPSRKFKNNIEIDTAETFFRVLVTNYTLNLLKPPTELKKAIKWTIILIVIGAIILLILHFTGVIDVMQLIGAKPPTNTG